MTDTIRDLLRQDADSVEIPTLDANDVIGHGEQRLHRRRVTAVLAAVAAVAVIAIGGIAANQLQAESQGPVDKPTRTDQHQRTVEPQTRKIVWSDDLTELTPGNDTPSTQVGTLHVGGREVEIDQVLHSVRYWVACSSPTPVRCTRRTTTASGSPMAVAHRRIASQACVISAGDLRQARPGDRERGTAGGLVRLQRQARAVTWSSTTPALVARSPATRFTPATGPSACLMRSWVNTCTSAGLDQATGLVEHQFRFDVTSGEVRRAGQQMYLDDLRAQPRTLVIGDTWQTGTPTAGMGGNDPRYFRLAGSRLVPVDDDASTRAFTVTGEPVRFRLPSGYQPRPTDVEISFAIFEWLDDDTVAPIQVPVS